jgi:H+/gluconate symporter-like permease
VRRSLGRNLAVTALTLAVALTIVYLVSDVLAERGVSPIALLWIGALLVVLAVGLVVQRQRRRPHDGRDPGS